MGIPVTELPIAKAEKAAADLIAQNPPPVEHTGDHENESAQASSDYGIDPVQAYEE